MKSRSANKSAVAVNAARSDNVIVDDEPTLLDWSGDGTPGRKSVAVDALHRIGIERNAELEGDAFTYSHGEMKTGGVIPTARRGDDCPVFRIGG